MKKSASIILLITAAVLLTAAVGLILNEFRTAGPMPEPPKYDEALYEKYKAAQEKGDFVAMNAAFEENMLKTAVPFFDGFDPTHGNSFYTYPYSAEVDGKEVSGTLYLCTEKVERASQSLGENDFFALDRRTAKDPEIVVYDSYRADSQILIKCLCTVLLEHEKVYPSPWERSLDSMVEEWAIHNAAYEMNYKVDHAKDVNLNNADESTDWLKRAAKELSQ